MFAGDAMLWTYSKTYIIDIAAGTVRMDGHPAFQMRVVQQGNAANDTILVPRGQNPIEATTNFTVEDIADATTDFIRIRQWEGRESRFMQYALDTMVSGTCEPIE
jgi:hypothetical protein